MGERYFLVGIYFFVFIVVLYIQLISPKISRRNIFMGVKLPEDKLEDEDLKNIYKSYRRNSLIVGLGGMVVSLFLTYRYYDNFLLILVLPLAYLIALFIVYLLANRRVKNLKKAKKWYRLADNTRIVDLDYSRELESVNILRSWGILPYLIVLMNIILALYFYPRLPNRIPIHWGIDGRADGYANKSLASVMMINILHIAILLVMYLSNLSIYRSRHEVRRSQREVSIEKNKIFKDCWSRYLKFTSLGMQLIFTYINLTILGLVKNMRYMLAITLVYLVLVIGGSIYLSLKLGQGGEKLELGEDDILETSYMMEDDSNWYLGNSIYYNKEDPSNFVEKRFGIGWTVNMARPFGKIFLIVTIILLLACIVISVKAL